MGFAFCWKDDTLAPLDWSNLPFHVNFFTRRVISEPKATRFRFLSSSYAEKITLGGPLSKACSVKIFQDHVVSLLRIQITKYLVNAQSISEDGAHKMHQLGHQAWLGILTLMVEILTMTFLVLFITQWHFNLYSQTCNVSIRSPDSWNCCFPCITDQIVVQLFIFAQAKTNTASANAYGVVTQGGREGWQI